MDSSVRFVVTLFGRLGIPSGAAAGIAIPSGDLDRGVGGLPLLGVNVGLMTAMVIFILLSGARAVAGRGPTLGAGFAILALSSCSWHGHQAATRVPGNPSERRSS